MGKKYANPETQFVIHPDNVVMYQRYAQVGPQAVQEMRESRDQLAREGKPYHNTDHDAEMTESARERTQVKAAAGWRFTTRG